MSDAELNLNDDQLVITQSFNASRSRLFACFTQPQLLSQWHAPSETMTTEAEVDLQVGGRYRISMTDPDGKPHAAIGQFYEIDEPNKLVYSWSWEGGEDPETMITVHFRESGSQTEVELTQTGFSQPEAAQHHSQGWTGIFSRLSLLHPDSGA